MQRIGSVRKSCILKGCQLTLLDGDTCFVRPRKIYMHKWICQRIIEDRRCNPDTAGIRRDRIDSLGIRFDFTIITGNTSHAGLHKRLLLKEPVDIHLADTGPLCHIEGSLFCERAVGVICRRSRQPVFQRIQSEIRYRIVQYILRA